MHKPSSEDQYRATSPSPLERRESFGLLGAGDELLSDPDDGPRNSFMKLCGYRDTLIMPEPGREA